MKNSNLKEQEEFEKLLLEHFSTVEKNPKEYEEKLYKMYENNKNILDLNRIDEDQKSLLMRAIMNKNIIASTLLINNSNLELKNEDGINALHQACLLKDCEDIVDLLLKKKLDLMYELNEKKQNCFHLVSGKNRLLNLKILLSYYDKNIDEKDNIGMSPFLKACASGSFEIVKEFIIYMKKKNNIININSVDNEGNTCLHYLFEFDNIDHQIVIDLLDLGCKPIKNNNGKFCFEISNNEKLKEVLLDKVKDKEKVKQL